MFSARDKVGGVLELNDRQLDRRFGECRLLDDAVGQQMRRRRIQSTSHMLHLFATDVPMPRNRSMDMRLLRRNPPDPMLSVAKKNMPSPTGQGRQTHRKSRVCAHLRSDNKDTVLLLVDRRRWYSQRWR